MACPTCQQRHAAALCVGVCSGRAAVGAAGTGTIRDQVGCWFALCDGHSEGWLSRWGPSAWQQGARSDFLSKLAAVDWTCGEVCGCAPCCASCVIDISWCWVLGGLRVPGRFDGNPLAWPLPFHSKDTRVYIEYNIRTIHTTTEVRVIYV